MIDKMIEGAAYAFNEFANLLAGCVKYACEQTGGATPAEIALVGGVGFIVYAAYSTAKRARTYSG